MKVTKNIKKAIRLNDKLTELLLKLEALPDTKVDRANKLADKIDTLNGEAGSAIDAVVSNSRV